MCLTILTWRIFQLVRDEPRPQLDVRDRAPSVSESRACLAQSRRYAKRRKAFLFPVPLFLFCRRLQNSAPPDTPTFCLVSRAAPSTTRRTGNPPIAGVPVLPLRFLFGRFAFSPSQLFSRPVSRGVCPLLLRGSASDRLFPSAPRSRIAPSQSGRQRLGRSSS